MKWGWMINWVKISRKIFWAQRISFGLSPECVTKSYSNAMKVGFFAFEIGFFCLIPALLASLAPRSLFSVVFGLLAIVIFFFGFLLMFLTILYSWFLMLFPQKVTFRLSTKIDLLCAFLWEDISHA